jgi:hypothetical protein
MKGNSPGGSPSTHWQSGPRPSARKYMTHGTWQEKIAIDRKIKRNEGDEKGNIYAPSGERKEKQR